MNTDFIVRYENVVPKDECKKVISYIDYLHENSFLASGIRGQSHFVDHESANITQDIQELQESGLHLVNSHTVGTELMKYMQPCVSDYLDKFSVLGQSRFLIVDMKVKKIRPGGGFHNWHFENGTVTTSQRHFVIQVYLNDDFEGGETEFLYQNRREKAVAGDVLIFPAAYTHVHRGNPPIGINPKYLATSWGWVQYEDGE